MLALYPTHPVSLLHIPTLARSLSLTLTLCDTPLSTHSLFSGSVTLPRGSPAVCGRLADRPTRTAQPHHGIRTSRRPVPFSLSHPPHTHPPTPKIGEVDWPERARRSIPYVPTVQFLLINNNNRLSISVVDNVLGTFARQACEYELGRGIKFTQDWPSYDRPSALPPLDRLDGRPCCSIPTIPTSPTGGRLPHAYSLTPFEPF